MSCSFNDTIFKLSEYLYDTLLKCTGLPGRVLFKCSEYLTVFLFKYLEFLLGLLFPPKCIFCSNLLPVGTAIELCNLCKSRLPYMKENFSIWDKKSLKELYYDDAVCLLKYDEKTKNMISQLKYKGKAHFAETIGFMLYDLILEKYDGMPFDIIIPVPLHRKRIAERGYNQSFLIAKAISRKSSGLYGQKFKKAIPVKNNLLFRITNTAHQAALPQKNRIDNVMNAFSIDYSINERLPPSKNSFSSGKTALNRINHTKRRYQSINSVCNKRILIIDDIMTTGSTLNECSKVLKNYGAAYIAVAVAASGRN